MARTFRFSFRALLLGASLAVGGSCFAAGDFMSTASTTPPMGEPKGEQSWYREQAKPDTETIIQQKAQIRAQQRMDRLASMQWYGMSGSRPWGTATPFTGRYGSNWEMPGGKPYSWYPYVRPGYVMYWR
jgi:hypothetical protein